MSHDTNLIIGCLRWVAGAGYALKTAPVVPEQLDDGKVVQTTTTRRVFPAEPGARERTTPEFWEYCAQVQPFDRSRHLFYIYRDDPGPSMQVGKHSWESSAAEGIPWEDREEAEAGFMLRYGGRQYRVILKRNSERVTTLRINIPALPKPLQPTGPDPAAGNGANSYGSSEASATADVAKQAMQTLASADSRGVAIGMDALTTAANVVRSFSERGASGPVAHSEMDDLFRQLMLRMMERMMQPPPQVDPIEQLTRIFALIRQVTPGDGATNPITGRIMDTALERLLNPAPSGPVSSAGAELVRQLPQVAGIIAEAVSNWRVGTEAQLKTAALMTGANGAPGAPPPGPGGPAPRVAQTGTILPPPGPAPAAAPNGGAASGEPSLEYVEGKIIEIFKQPQSADAAADETVAFLATLNSGLIVTLRNLGEQGLLQLFHNRPGLRPATANMPRLIEFVQAFIRYAGEVGEGPEPKPALPN